MQKRKRALGAAIGTMLSLGLLINPNAELSPVYGADAPVAINETNFPDAVFREYVKDNFDEDGNGELSASELESVTDVNVSNMNIADLTGIEYFINLRLLKCANNQLSSLDVSKNTVLEELYCGKNNLSSLDVSQNTALEQLVCSENNLSSLDVGQNTALERLVCNENNLSSLNVSQNTALEWLECDDNQLSSLDVSQDTALRAFECANNQLSSLDVSQNTALEWLVCSGNNLSSLDVSQNTALGSLYCYNNQLSSLDMSQNTALVWLECGNNQLSSLDVSQNTALVRLECSGNKLSSLDVSQNTALESLDYLGCYGNEISLPLYQVGSQYYIDLSPLHLDTRRVGQPSSGTYDSTTGHIEWQSFAAISDVLTYQYDIGYQNQTMEVTVNISKDPIVVMEATTSSPSTEVTEQDISQSTNTTATVQNTPKTGDTMLPVWIAILGLFSTVSYLVARKKK